jgi:hypothetical protein
VGPLYTIYLCPRPLPWFFPAALLTLLKPSYAAILSPVGVPLHLPAQHHCHTGHRPPQTYRLGLAASFQRCNQPILGTSHRFVKYTTSSYLTQAKSIVSGLPFWQSSHQLVSHFVCQHSAAVSQAAINHRAAAQARQRLFNHVTSTRKPKAIVCGTAALA